ncbi:protein SUPPRESSOR OF GENE SILENCING 3-like isoform X2 [Syzygium oleosum]|uniref:protein SUPPRESSOR OF GENE SILENCING 3-like isoform X2 n=1 Tax=Syzygium oleosum TaxID=219896 RepID=UPI0024BAB449|nr:protein SUPPRESSOR OF GENE SILENCING 3-like isoform X2 [Syzygium oleosum]
MEEGLESQVSLLPLISSNQSKSGCCWRPVDIFFYSLTCLRTKMNSRRGSPGSSSSGNNSHPTSEGKETSDVEHLSRGVGEVRLDSAPDDGGEWEVYARKSKTKAGSSSGKPWPPQNSNSKAWGQQDVGQKLVMQTNSGLGRAAGSNSWFPQTADFRKPAGRGSMRSPQYVAPQTVISAPLENGWNWQDRAGLAKARFQEDDQINNNLSSNDVASENSEADEDHDSDNADVDDDDIDMMDDSDDDLMSDEFDSDASQKSHGTRKNNRWFKKFFEIMDSLTVDEINEPGRQWHCPACRGGPGAIDWYRGLQPLMAHAKTKGANRVMLHRELAELLDEELMRRGASVVPAGEVFGKWRGLNVEEKDYDIVWPPMVVIMNTILEKDESDKWIGMGSQELLDYFSSYQAVKARHAYGPQGHRGMSILIFESSPRGFYEAERLHKHFADQGTSRNAWDRRGALFHPGGKRQLYGYMAMKEDVYIFNRHSQGKSKLKFEMRSFKEMVVNQVNQMTEDNQLLIWLKNRVVQERMHSKALEKSFDIVSEKLRKTMEENRIVRHRTKMQHEQNKEEMDYQEQFFKEQMKVIHDELNAKEEDFEREQQEKRERVKQSNANPSSAEDNERGMEEIAEFIQLQEKEMDEFVAKREMLEKEHEDKQVAMKKRHWDEEVELEKEFKTQLTQLMESYSHH